MFYVGLDLGQAADFTAVCVLERISVDVGICKKCRGKVQEIHHHLRHVERFPQGTSYPDIVKRVQDLVRSDQLKSRYLVLADGTGCGRPVIDLLRGAHINHRSIIITGGNAVTVDSDAAVHMPKKVLVSNLQVLLQTRRLKMSESLPEVKTLVDELLNFRVKITAAGNDTYSAWRERDHDDLVLALAMAAWWSEERGADDPDSQPRTPQRALTSLSFL